MLLSVGSGSGIHKECSDLGVPAGGCSIDGSVGVDTRVLEQELDDLFVAFPDSNTDGGVILGSRVDAVIAEQKPDDLCVAVLGSNTDGVVVLGSRVDAVICEQELDDLGVAAPGSKTDGVVCPWYSG